MDRRRFLAAGGMATALLGGFPARLLAADPAVTGSWTAPFNLGLVSIHAILLHTGNVLLFSWPNDTVGSDAVLWNPATGRTTNIALTYQRDIFCSGTTVLSDGRVFIAGGHIWQGALNPTQGVINTTIFDPASSAWTEGPMMSQARWYPTTTLLDNGTVIICGGLLAWTNSATTYYLNPATARRVGGRPRHKHRVPDQSGPGPGRRGRVHPGPGHPSHHGQPPPLGHRRHGQRHRGRHRWPHLCG